MKTMLTLSGKKIPALLLLLTLSVSPKLSAQTDWQVGDGNWITPGNWSAGVPNALINANILNGGSATLNTPGQTASTLNIGGIANGTLTLSNGGTLSVMNASVGQTTTGTGTLILDGVGTHAIFTDPVTHLSVGNGGTGILIVRNGAILDTTEESLREGNFGTLENPNKGFVTVTGAGSTINNGQNFDVGSGANGGVGNGTLTILAGGHVNTIGMGIVGFKNGSNGTVLIDGAGSQWSSHGYLVGNSGLGIITLQNGGALINDTVQFLIQNGTVNVGSAAGGTTGGSIVSNTNITLSNGVGQSILSFNQTDAFDLNPILEGSGTVIQNGTGTTIFHNLNTYAGVTTVNAGVLQAGGAGTFSPNTNVTVNGGTLDLNGFNQTLLSLNNNPGGTVNLAGAGVGTQLVVSGDYAGGGTLHFKSVLNQGGASSVTDQLLVNGSTNGTSRVIVTNAGGPGALTGHGPTSGIPLILVAGASAGNFVLGQRATAGLYDYDLVKADAQNFYLQSRLSPEVPVLTQLNTIGLIATTVELNSIFNQIGDFHQLEDAIVPDPVAWAPAGVRDSKDLKEVRDTRAAAIQEEAKKTDIWGRGFYSEDNLHTGNYGSGRVDTYGAQIGGDRRFHNVFSGNDRLYLGGFGEYATAEGRPNVGRNEMDSYGAGVYATYYNQGWYADAILKGDVNNYKVLVPGAIEQHTSGYALAASVEVGYQFNLGSGWALEPQVQGIVQRQTIENLTDSQGRVYRYQDPESISGRAGLKLQKCFIASKTLRITPYLRASVVQEMLGTNDLSLNNITLSTPYGGTSLMTDGGVTVNLRKNVDIFASGVLVTGSKIDSTGVNGGLRFAW